MIKEVGDINGVVNGSFGWRKPSQILLLNQNNQFDYTELTHHFLMINKTGLRDQVSVTMDQVFDAMSDRSLSAESLAAAKVLYSDISDVRALTDKVGLYAQNVEHENGSSKWHFDRNERTILAKYNGAATQIAHMQDVLSHESDVSPYAGFVLCDVDENAKVIEMDNGSVYSITGTDRFFGRATAHRKAPLDGQASLILIAEP